jgi:hypothetical protein
MSRKKTVDRKADGCEMISDWSESQAVSICHVGGKKIARRFGSGQGESWKINVAQAIHKPGLL